MTAIRNLARTLWRHIVAPDPAGPHKSSWDLRDQSYEGSAYTERARRGGRV